MKSNSARSIIGECCTSVRERGLTWPLGTDNLLDHGGHDISEVIRGVGETPAVPLVTLLLLLAIVPMNHVSYAEPGARSQKH